MSWNDDLPTSGHSSVISPQSDHVIIFGGKCKKSIIHNDVWELQLPEIGASETKITKWKTTGSTIEPRAFHTSHVYKDMMYVFFGISSDGNSDVSELPTLNLTTKEWTFQKCTGTPPSRRTNHASVVKGKVVYLIGGMGTTVGTNTPATEFSTLYKLDFDTFVWTSISLSDVNPKLSPCLWGHTMTSYGPAIWCYGGVDVTTDRQSELMWVYHTEKKAWRWYSARHPGSRNNDQIFASVKKGVSWKGDPNVNKQLSSLTDSERIQITSKNVNREAGEGWWKGKKTSTGEEGWFPGKFCEIVEHQSSTTAPECRTYHSSTLAQGYMIIYGGQSGSQPKMTLSNSYNDCWKLLLSEGKWSTVASESSTQPPQTLCKPFTHYDGKLYIPTFEDGVIWMLDVRDIKNASEWIPIPIKKSKSTKDVPSSTSEVTESVRSSRAPYRSVPSCISARADSPLMDSPRVGSPVVNSARNRAPATNSYVPSTTTTTRFQSSISARPGSPFVDSPKHHRTDDQPTSPAIASDYGNPYYTPVITPVAHGMEYSPASGIRVNEESRIEIDPLIAGGDGDQKTIVVYVVNGNESQNGIPAVMLPNGMSTPMMSSSPMPMMMSGGGHPTPPPPQKMGSVPADQLREPARDRITARVRTSSPHVHTTDAGRKSSYVSLPEPPPNPVLDDDLKPREGSGSPSPIRDVSPLGSASPPTSTFYSPPKFTPAPSPSLQCPVKAHAPPRSLLPMQGIGHPMSPQRGTSSSHTYIKDLGIARSISIVSADGPGGRASSVTHVDEHRRGSRARSPGGGVGAWC